MLKQHILYISGTGSLEFLIEERDRICAQVLESFRYFTVQEAIGYFDGQRQPWMLVRIGTQATHDVIALAERLRRSLGQEAIGLEMDGIYRRVRGGTLCDD
jgi:hypothetical protein